MTGWDLIRAAQGGDRDAFGEFYRRYRPIVASFLRSRRLDQHTAEDLTSEVFLRAWRRIDTVTELRDDPAAWLVTIARNLVFDHAKSSHHRLSQPVAEIPEPRRAGTGAGTVAPSAEVLALDGLDRDEIAAQVRAVVAGLRPDQREALAGLLAERSHAEEAARTGCTVGVSKTRRLRALRAARAALAGEVAA